MAPGFEDAEALAATKARTDYWAKSAPKPGQVAYSLAPAKMKRGDTLPRGPE